LYSIFLEIYLASTLVSPGLSTVIEPAQTHIVLLVSSMAGNPPILSFLATGLQGITGTGMQEEGTNTGTGPAIFQFIGLAGEVHWPKAGIFKKGTKSIWVAMGLVLAFMVMPMGSTTMSFGPEPKEHFNLALMQTHFGINLFFQSCEMIANMAQMPFFSQ
jgi:hypothetical protein